VGSVGLAERVRPVGRACGAGVTRVDLLFSTHHASDDGTAVGGESHIGFLSRQIDEHILCVTELAHYCESNNKPGLFVALDNVKAYDRVQHSFLQKVLEAFGFPSEFRQLINTMYTDIKSALKVNGHIGKTFPVTNSLRQGCSLSLRQLYLLVHEVL
jgi:hypothetical protein